MEKLKVNFLQIQNVLLMKVVYQDDSISIGNLRWSSDQGYIYSSSLPAMDWPILYIRGTNKKKIIYGILLFIKQQRKHLTC